MPEYSSKLYSFLAQNDPEFSKKLTEDQFVNKLSTDSGYSKKLYDFLAQSDAEFSKKLDYNQFQVKTNLKKKVSTEVSKPSVGSSVTTKTPQKQSSDSSKPDGIYKFPTNPKANYKKEAGQWYVDPNGGTKFQPLTKGDVAKRVKVLESQAKREFNPYLETEEKFEFKAETKQAKPTEKVVGVEKKAQDVFKKEFQALDENDPIVIQRNTQDKKTNELISKATTAMNLGETEAIVELKKIFNQPGYNLFDFEETGAGDAVKVINKKTGESKVFAFDTDDKTEMDKLTAFVNMNVKYKAIGDLTEESKKLQEQIDATYDPNKKLELSRKLKEVNNKLKIEESVRLSDATTDKNKAWSIYDKDAQQNAKAKIDSQLIRSIDYREKKKDLDKRQADLDAALRNNKLSYEDYKTKYLPSILAEKEQLSVEEKEIKSTNSELAYESDRLNEVAGYNMLAQAERGDFLSGISASFLKGVESPFRLIAGSAGVKTEKGFMMDELLAGLATDEYISDEKRSDIEKALFSVSESLGAAAGGAALTGGVGGVMSGPGATLGTYALSYYSLKDEIDSDPDMANVSEGEKMLLSGVYGGVIGLLDKFGLSKSLSKNPLGKKVVNGIVDKVLTSLPKNATAEMIETAVNSEVKTVIAKGIVNTAGGFVNEGATEGLQEFADVTIRDLYNKAKGKELLDKPKTWGEIFERAGESFWLGGLGGAAMSGATQAVEVPKQLRTVGQLKSIERIIDNPDMMDIFTDDLKVKVLNGEMSASKAKAAVNEMRESQAVFNMIPADVENKYAAFKLISEREFLSKEIEGKDPALVEDKKQRVNQIEEELRTLPKKQENAIQERSTEEVLPREQEQAGEARSQREGMGQSIKGEEVTQEGVKEVEDLRAKEQAELIEALPNAEQYMTDGKVDRAKITDENDLKVFDEIYNKYDEIITPLIKGTKEEVEFEDIVIPQNELDLLNEELSRKNDEGTINDNLDQAGYIGDEYGTIRIDPENENTIVFETNSRIIELGTVDEVKNSNISSFGISLFPQTEVKAENESSALTLDGKKYKIIGRRRDKKGKAVVRVKELETGLERRIIGEKAEQILKDQALAKDKKPNVTLNLATEGKEPVINNKKRDKKEEAKKAKEEFEAKTLEELKAEEDRLEKEVKDFEDNLLQEIAKESKKEKRLTLKIKDAEFTVSEKSDGTYSVSQKNENGKFVGIKDEAKRKVAISEYKKTRESNDTNRLNLATELTEDFKREKDDKILALLDKAIAATSGKGKLFDASLGIPVMFANTSLKIIKASYKAGKTLSEAINEGYQFLKKSGYNISEYDFKMFVSKNINKPLNEEKESLAAKAAKAITKTTKTMVTFTVDEMEEYKKLIKKEIKDVNAGKKSVVNAIKTIADAIKMRVTKGQMDRMQLKYIMNKLAKVNFSKQESVDSFIDYVFKKMTDAEYLDKLSAINKINKAIKNSKNMVAEVKYLADMFTKIDLSQVANIDKHLEIANKLKESLARYTKQTDPTGVEFRKNVDYQELYDYVSKNEDKLKTKIEKSLSDIYDKLFGDGASDGMSDEDMIKNINKAKADKVAEMRDIVEAKLEELKNTIDEDTPDIIKRAVSLDPKLVPMTDLIDIINGITMYIDNGIVSGMKKVVAKYEGLEAANKSKIRFKQLIGLFGKGSSIAYNTWTNFVDSILTKKIAKAGDVEQFKKESGNSDIELGYNKAAIERNKKESDYKKKFGKIKGFNKSYNIMERFLVSHMQRALMDTEAQEEYFEDRKSLIESSINNLIKGSNNTSLVEIGKLMQESAIKLGILNEDGSVNKNSTIDDINSKAQKFNLDAVKYVQDMFSDIYDALYDHSLGFYNVLLERDLNYTPDVIRGIKKAFETDKDATDKSDFSRFTGMLIKKAGILMKTDRPSSLTDKYMSPDFDQDMFSAYESALRDLYTSEHKQKFNAYRSSAAFNDIMGKDKNGVSRDADLINERYNAYVNVKEGNIDPDDKTDRQVKKFLNSVGLYNTVYALGSLKNVIAQSVPTWIDAIFSTKAYLNPRRTADIITDSFNPQIWDFVERCNSQVALRGKDAVRFTETVKDMMKKESFAGDVKKVSSKIFKFIPEQIIKITNQYPDKVAAIGTWMGYYKEYCRKNKIPVDLAVPNADAINYAETKTKVQILPSDNAERGKIGTNNSAEMAIIRQMLMPFSSFSLGQKNRIYGDVLRLFRGDRINAANDIVGALAGVTAFQMINHYWKIYAGSIIVSALFGDDDDEEERAKLIKSSKANSIIQGMQDYASPLPFLDVLVPIIGNKAITSLDLGLPEEKEWLKHLEEKKRQKFAKENKTYSSEEIEQMRAKFFEENQFKFKERDELEYAEKFGSIGISIKVSKQLLDIYRSATTGKYISEFNGKPVEKNLTEKGREEMEKVLLWKLSSLSGLTDVNNQAQKYYYKVGKNMSLTDKQLEEYESLGDAGKRDFMKKLGKD